MTDDNGAFADFWNDLLREAEVYGEPQHACFFQMFSQIAAENGDCIDLTYTPVRKEGTQGYQVDGYAVDKDRAELYLAICDFRTEEDQQTLNQSQLEVLYKRVERFVKFSQDPAFINSLEETSPTFEAAHTIYERYPIVKRVRIIIFSNARLVARKKSVDSKEVNQKTYTYNLLDFGRYTDIQNSRSGSEPIEIDISELNGTPLACLPASLDTSDYSSFLVVMPGQLLSKIYGLYGARLLEQNVRTFLQAKTKVNKGIITTLERSPNMFFAYNNGLTATASAVEIEPLDNGMPGICSIRNFQIVNGGQTTASILYAQDNKSADLSQAFVQMKLSVVEDELIEAIVPRISRFANTQNKISESDFFSSHPFHLEMEKISRRLPTPQKAGSFSTSKWFYERARGQYKDQLAYGTAKNKKKFEAEYPKDQWIVKTDLAKYELSYECKPHIVSQGAQKCFMNFADIVGKAWDEKPAQFNESYYKEAVAKAILFRWADKMVARSDWYKEDRGHKANIVTYTIAWMVNNIRVDSGKCLDLQKIWNSQDLTEDLKDALAYCSPMIAVKIKDTPSNVKNIGEYCKQQACWAAVSKVEIDLPIYLDAALVGKSEIKQQKKDAVAIKKMDDEIDFETYLLQLIPHLSDLVGFADSRSLLSPNSSRALNKLLRADINLNISEKKALKNLLVQLDKEGYELIFE